VPLRGVKPPVRHEERLVLDLAWRTILRVLLAAALVWLLITLREVVLVFMTAAVLALAIEPLVRWLGRHGLARGAAVAVVSVAIIAIVGGFLYVAWESLLAQAQLTSSRLWASGQDLARQFPALQRLVEGTASGMSGAMDGGLALSRTVVRAAFVLVLGFILTVYLLLDGERTYRWVRTFVPERHRRKVDATAREAQRAVAGYVAGNVATSIFAAAFTGIVLTVLHVPAALMLALLAGLFDFVPVLGFICSAVPAVLLALTRSSATALAVLALYAGYHLVENYVIAPKVYGNRLRLSDTAVLLAFAAGAELGGVIGALLALPVAAVYPCVEQIWLSHRFAGVVREHQRLEQEP
jgi:predicted PurR-regulated permease PerM